MRIILVILKICLSALLLSITLSAGESKLPAQAGGAYDDLIALFSDWRAFEHSPASSGVPDYTAEGIARMEKGLAGYRERLAALDLSGWPVEQQVDYHLVRAEMNGLDFYLRVLKPWQRDPAFYTSIFDSQSDTPAHEGPEHHAIIDLWTYSFPLSKDAAKKLTAGLHTIAPLLKQARGNLTGNARELWIGGIGNLRGQAKSLERLEKQAAGAGRDFKKALAEAREATAGFISWLEEQSPSKTGPSGVGKDNYTWHLQNVLLVPMTWEEEVALLQRELARAHSSLLLEEQCNKHLPPLVAISGPEEFKQRTATSIDKLMSFLEQKEMLPMRDYMKPALQAQTGSFVPEEKRNFFVIAIHYEPNTLNTHFYHWWDLAQMEETPHQSPIRRKALLYNVWNSRAEGMATAFEEITMHAGLYDDNPQVREIVWIMLAQRAARGLGSLYAHANEFTMKEARDFHVKWTPRGWMREDLDLLGFEQLLYMRQPGYGSSYITGKYQIDKLLMERSKQLGDSFNLSAFFEEFNAAGVIPVSMISWQLTGKQ